jgi:hypothetical protein
VAWCEVAACLLVAVWVCDLCGFIAERGEERGMMLGVVVAGCGCDGIGECNGEDVIEHGVGVTLGTGKSSKGGRSVAMGYCGLRWPMVV